MTNSINSINSIYGGERKTVKLIKLHIEEEQRSPIVELYHYQHRPLGSEDISDASTQVTTYKAEIKKFCVVERGKRRNIKIVLDKNAQELVDLMVEVETKVFKQMIANDLRINDKKIEILHRKIKELQNPWYKKLLKRIL